jgi:hypothetical protein
MLCLRRHSLDLIRTRTRLQSEVFSLTNNIPNKIEVVASSVDEEMDNARHDMSAHIMHRQAKK